MLHAEEGLGRLEASTAAYICTSVQGTFNNYGLVAHRTHSRKTDDIWLLRVSNIPFLELVIGA